MSFKSGSGSGPVDSIFLPQTCRTICLFAALFAIQENCSITILTASLERCPWHHFTLKELLMYLNYFENSICASDAKNRIYITNVRETRDMRIISCAIRFNSNARYCHEKFTCRNCFVSVLCPTGPYRVRSRPTSAHLLANLGVLAAALFPVRVNVKGHS